MPPMKPWVQNYLDRKVDGNRFPLTWELTVDEAEDENEIAWIRDELLPARKFVRNFLADKYGYPYSDSIPSQPEMQECPNIIELLEVP